MPENTQLVKQLVILSGKGGTGKTSVTAALIHLASLSEKEGVYVDADVDAANLALVTNPTPLEKEAFFGSLLAQIDPKMCTSCGMCFDVCRFTAIYPPTEEHITYRVNEMTCDGCSACVHFCPESAIHMETQQDGEWYHSISKYGHLFHAELFPGAENTGKLVTTVKQHAKLFAEDHELAMMIVDGPPGIGCPVISASAGAVLALLVAEPGVSGIHDLERIIDTLSHFKIPILICINKADIYPQGSSEIEELAETRHLPLTNQIPFDQALPQAMVKAMPVTEYAPESSASKAIIELWQQVQTILFGGIE